MFNLGLYPPLFYSWRYYYFRVIPLEIASTSINNARAVNKSAIKLSQEAVKPIGECNSQLSINQDIHLIYEIAMLYKAGDVHGEHYLIYMLLV